MALTKVGKEGITGISNASDANAITIDSSENVGIGTSSPSSLLHINNTADSANGITIQNASSSGSADAYLQFTTANSTVRMGIDATGTDLFKISNGTALGTNDALAIDSNGNVNIGTTSTLNSSFVAIEFNGTTHNGIVLKTTRTTQTGSNYLYFVNSSGTNTGSIQQTGTTTVAFNTSSDYRLKENVVTDWDATTRLKQLKPSRFNFIADGTDRVVDGFLAHEVSSIVPEAICGEKDAVDDDGNAVYQGIDQSKLVPLLVKTIQELEARITALESA